MATFTISGGTGVPGARVQCLGPDNVTQIQTADDSGNYSFTVSDLTTYFLVADTYGLTGGFAGYVFRNRHAVSVDGANVGNVNFNATSPSASNDPSTGNF